MSRLFMDGCCCHNSNRRHGRGRCYLRALLRRANLHADRLPIPRRIVLAVLTAINCLGVRAGSTVQSILMVLKIVAIAALVVCGFLFAEKTAVTSELLDRPLSGDLLTAFGAALVPVIFAYGGWQTATFVAGEIREPRKNLPRGLILA